MISLWARGRLVTVTAEDSVEGKLPVWKVWIGEDRTTVLPGSVEHEVLHLIGRVWQHARHVERTRERGQTGLRGGRRPGVVPRARNCATMPCRGHDGARYRITSGLAVALMLAWVVTGVVTV